MPGRCAGKVVSVAQGWVFRGAARRLARAGEEEESAEGPRGQPAAARDPRRLRTGEGGVEFWANEDDAWVERREQTQPPKPGPPTR